MGEPLAFLVRSYSQPSPTSSEEKKGNSIKRALTSSISFGRFVSESLDWERFSAFNQNRYLEEVERYSKPGSVAEKKAYFEAHYKRKRAAALLEQQNIEPNNVPQSNVTCKVEDYSCLDSKSTMREVSLVSENTKQEEVPNCDMIVSVSCEAEIARELGDGLSERGNQANEPMVVVENPVQLTNHLENDEYVLDISSNEESMKCEDASSTPSNEEKPDVSSSNLLASSIKQVPPPPVPPPVKPIMPGRLVNKETATLNSKNIAKDFYNKTTRTTPTSNEEKPQVSSSELLRNISSTRQVPLPRIPPSVKPVTPGRLVNKEKTTMNSRNNEKDSNKNTRSLHMSINFPPCLVETQKAIHPVLPPKNVNSRHVKTRLKKPNNNSLPQILTRASVNGICNTSSENRTVRPHGSSFQGSRILDSKLQSPSTSYSRTSNTLASNGRSLVVSASFTFKSEERVAKRKEFFEKLGQKLKSDEPNKQPYAKPQKNARNDLKDHLKVTMSIDIPPRVDKTSMITKKSLNAISIPPKVKERAPFRVQNNDPRPPWRFSTKMDSSEDIIGKNNNIRPPIYSAKSYLKKSACENSSPNV